MPLEFDPNKSFDENIAEFQKYLEQLDPECAEIFSDEQPKLFGDGISVQGNRTVFNDAVLERLKMLAPKKAGD